MGPAGISIVRATCHTNKGAQYLYESLGYKKEEGFYTYTLAL